LSEIEKIKIRKDAQQSRGGGCSRAVWILKPAASSASPALSELDRRKHSQACAIAAGRSKAIFPPPRQTRLLEKTTLTGPLLLHFLAYTRNMVKTEIGAAGKAKISIWAAVLV
jgi:hypothetical protein